MQPLWTWAGGGGPGDDGEDLPVVNRAPETPAPRRRRETDTILVDLDRALEEQPPGREPEEGGLLL